MDVWSSLLDGFATAATPTNLLYALIGVLLGTAVGVLPGLGPAMNEPMAAVARACAARPARAILCPSMAVTTDEDSPGVLRRIEVVEPPYMPP